jgi:hypothetical protein
VKKVLHSFGNSIWNLIRTHSNLAQNFYIKKWWQLGEYMTIVLPSNPL